MANAQVVKFLSGSSGKRDQEHKFGYRSLLRHIKELLAYNRWGTIFFVLAIVVGFFHGLIKLRFSGVLVALSYDILLILSMVFTALNMSKGSSFFPRSAVASALVLQITVCAVYMVISFEVPFLVSLASFRGWCLAPMGFFLGYHLTRSVRQLEVFILMLIVLGVATAIYGIFFQTKEEIQALMASNPELNYRLQGLFYSTETGAHFRTFSTFVTPAAFGGTMAYCIMFAFSRMTVEGCPKWERLGLLGAAGIMAYGMFLSGSRTALAITIVGLGVTAWYRRSMVRFAILPGVVGFGVIALAEMYRGGVSERFLSLFDRGELWGRLWIVVAPAWSFMSENIMGGGLGRSGHGVPAFFMNYDIHWDLRAIDGDLGRIMVDFGLVGIFMFFYIAFAGIYDATRWMRELRDTSPGVVALPCAAMFALNLVMWPTGSPFLGIPGGVLTWFFVGAVRHIVDEYRRVRESRGHSAAEEDEFFVSFLTQKKQSMAFQPNRKRNATHQKPVRQAASATSQLGRNATSLRPAPVQKRFLYKRD